MINNRIAQHDSYYDHHCDYFYICHCWFHVDELRIFLKSTYLSEDLSILFIWMPSILVCLKNVYKLIRVYIIKMRCLISKLIDEVI